MSTETSSIVFTLVSSPHQSTKRLYRLRYFARALSHYRTQPPRAVIAFVNESHAELERSETSIG